jgi:glycosyltransferase involved in cell wall biosynthesis
MSVKNGEMYLEEQVRSILPQLGVTDELVACDDGSTDKSLKILQSFRDPRIRIVHSPGGGIVGSFSHSLTQSLGDLIFLADQDDLWSLDKIDTMARWLDEYDLVVCDCAMMDESQRVEVDSFFELNGSGKGLVKNLIHNSYMGCCMAFRRSVLKKALPFPATIAMHDYWIGLVAELHFRTTFIPETLVWHRKHSSNHSTTGKKSSQTYTRRISQRIQLLKNLVQRAHVKA